jgi:hypothetical protein
MVYKPTQQLSLDEAMIPWRRRLRIRTYNPAKLTKYGLLVHVVTERTSGYIGNFKLYAAEGMRLEETIFCFGTISGSKLPCLSRQLL